ncbi:hypothetical protein SAMD00019534_055250 [Acytostelium subglobosum LB1]|uniref:hypothetical protein n=1 Tax=Acytostelium subglobosum LB1 TaxID=1410327 RepID=UPI000644975A|nr:hypothetical protein SAMD00019534_055250 [Acytostelium subglobosum LB1]GAM22350.1 hypothetical protein SAMD00019534_055250 [Acytostelium subglobosum LB1]|eukprot:XP_012754470.1 hypothetical protein SAMD00019534_055250 [Acytostelium subglobosum LB1]
MSTTSSNGSTNGVACVINNNNGHCSNNNRKFVNLIIRNVVQQNSIPDGTIPSPEAQFSLTKYFDDPNTVDLVFLNMMDRVRNERSHYEQVLSRILKLIKNNIALHPPSVQTLLDLDAFCVITAQTSSNQLQKSITYIRALISNQMRVVQQQQLTGSGSSDKQQLPKIRMTTSTSSNVGLARTRSQSATASMSHNLRDSSDSGHNSRDPTILQRASLDLSNGANNSTNTVGSGSSSVNSNHSSPYSDSPLRSALSTSLNNAPLSPNLVSSYTSNSSAMSQALDTPMSFSGSSIPTVGSSHHLLKDSSSSVVYAPTQEDGYICDLINLKTWGKINSQTRQKIQSMLTHSPFGIMKSGEAKGKDIFQCPDDTSNMKPIKIVQQAKKKVERKDATITLRRRKAPALFQYKYYKEQEPLKISEDERQQVIRVINNPSTPQERSIASKIFIKILLDIYCKSGLDGEKTVLAYLKQIITSDHKDARIHLFNIIYNLSVHINIYSELKLIDDGSSGMIGELQDSVYSLLRDILNHCVQNKERDEKVWMEALNCTLFFIVHQGVVLRSRLLQLNPQAIACFLKYAHDASDQIKRTLVRMLCNFLYKDAIPNQQGHIYLNEDELNKVGGIDFILKLYTTIRSNEAKNNLFVVIFDYALQSSLKSQTISETQLTQEAPLLLELFKRADVPHYFVQLFKCIPEKDFVSDFFLFTTMSTSSASSQGKLTEATYSEDLIIKFSMKVHELAIRFQKVEANLESQEPDKTAALLQQWLFNDHDEVVRNNGVNLLYSSIKKIMVDNESPNILFNLFMQLATHQDAHIRRIYITITQRLLLVAKYKYKGNEATKSQEIIDLFNDCIVRIANVSSIEKDEDNLIYIADILFDLIYSRNGSKSLYIRDTMPDTNFSLFLNNQFVISTSLLKLVSVGIIHYLFSNISPSNDKYFEPRLVLLHLLIMRCRDAETLEKAGGISFFKSLMHDPCTQIAYHSSYFLLSQLEAESPEQYRSILTRLLTKARENNDENLISNPFFQVQGIISMTHK